MRAPIKRISTGIDVGTHTTRVLVMEHTPGEAPKILGMSAVESRGMRRGYIVNKGDARESIARAIAQAEKNAGVKIKSALLSVGGVSLDSTITHGTATISRASGEVGEQDIEKAIQEATEALTSLANKRVIYRTPVAYRLDGKEVLGSPLGLIGSKIEVKMLFVMCLEHHLHELVKTIEDLGVEIDEILPSPIAAGHITLSKKQRSVGCCLVNIGAETVSIVVFENDVPISLHIFPIGSTDITNDIALGLKIPLEEAEHIKITGMTGAHSKKKLSEIVEARLSDIFELIESHLKKIKRNGLLPAGIVLTGGGSGIATIEDLARAALRLPSTLVNTHLVTSNKQIVRDSAWLVAYGLAVYALERPKERTEPLLGQLFGSLKSWVKPFLP